MVAISTMQPQRQQQQQKQQQQQHEQKQALHAARPARSFGLALAFAFTALLLALAQGPRGAAAHGILTQPRSRNWIAYLDTNYYWPDGLNAGGYKVAGKNGALTWPASHHGLCGDPADDKPQKFMQPGAVQATYKAGDVVDVHVMITTNHYGQFAFDVCPLSASKDSDCTLLERADGKGPYWDLPAVVEGSKFNGGALGANLKPAGGDSGGGPFTWYPQPHVDCGYWKYCTRFEGTPVYVLKYRLPKGFKCDRCLLRWKYTTGHKCHPPCRPSNKHYPDCKKAPQFAGTYLATMATCGGPWAVQPEEFWNCADIKIA